MMYTAMDLSQKSIQIAARNSQGKFVKECKIDKNANLLLDVLKGLGKKNTIKIVMESRYNHQYPYKLLRELGYDAIIAQPFMVKAIAYAKVKTDKVDARMLANLLAAELIPEAYIPETEIQDLRDLVRSRLGLVRERVHKNKIKADLAKRWITINVSTQMILGQKCLRELNIWSIND